MKSIVCTTFLLCLSLLTACAEKESVNADADKETGALADSANPSDAIDPTDPVNPPDNEDFSQAVTLNWNPIFMLEGGSVLLPSEIDSYILYWGRSASSQPETIRISDFGAQSYVFTATERGDYYFSVAVETVYGMESAPSNVVHKEVN